MNDRELKSPCISVCALDKNDICTGCFRSAEEITDWRMASNQQKHDILLKAQQRRQASSSLRLS